MPSSEMEEFMEIGFLRRHNANGLSFLLFKDGGEKLAPELV